MSRATIDFGIDLGTTNSAIATLQGTIAQVIKNNLDNDITPSAVYIDKRGEIQIGQRAKHRMEDLAAADDAYIEFKRRMGTDHKYEFKTAGRTMRPEELSAEVLKSLKGDVRQRLGEDINACVITVPAAFEQKQCAATKKAGELAGLVQCPLIMEPSAAAMAYGYRSDITKEYWLVYDFGGGTFDACLMKAEEGSINIVNHGGDNYLGGSDIDWAIIEQLVIPDLVDNYNLPDFSRGNTKWRTALAVVKRATENAKIQLSRSDTAYLEDCRIKDNDGEDVEVDLKLTRDAVIGVAEPIIMRSIEICKRVLKEKNLAPSAVEKVILVGGPTLAPYFREMLHTNLGISLDHSVDPLTVVAKGAAVFAGTQRLDKKLAAKASAGQYNVDLKYKPMGPEEDPVIRGEVKSASGTTVEGFTIEFVNENKLWRSGKIPLKKEGRFKTNLLAQKGEQNVFSIELLDPTGSKQVSVPDSVAYTIMVVISEQPIIHTVSVGLANNETAIFFKKGDPLPAKKTEIFHTSAGLRKGETGDAVKVPLVEGENEHADRNVLLGMLEIKGSDIKRDVPAGSEVEVTVNMDEDRILRTKAYVTMLDEEFEAVIKTNERSADPKRLEEEFEAEEGRRDRLIEQADSTDNERCTDLLNAIPDMDQIEVLVHDAKGDRDAADKAERQLLEVKIALDEVEDLLKWPALITEANKAVEDMNELIGRAKNASEEHIEAARQIEEEVEEICNGDVERPEALKKHIAAAHELYFDIQRERPEWWVGWFQFIEERSSEIPDQNAANRLLSQGRQAIQTGNLNMLRHAVAQLMTIMPRDVAEEVQRGFGHGLVR